MKAGTHTISPLPAASARVAPRPPAEPALRVALFAFALEGEPQSPVPYALDTARALVSCGADVHVFVNGPPQPSEGRVQVHTVVAVDPEPGLVPMARGLCAAAVEHFSRVVRDHGAFHVAHACQWSAGPAALVARRHGAAHTVVTFLDTVFSREGHCNGDQQTAQIRRMEQQAVQDADAIVAGSEVVRQELAWLYSAADGHVHTLCADALEPAAVPPSAESRQALGLAAGEIGVAFAGDWSAAGGSDLFLGAAGLVRREFQGARFAVVSEGAGSVRVEADIRRRGLADGFRFAREGVSSDQVLAACDVVVVPARRTGSYRPVLRAWRAGRPVVVTRTGPVHPVRPARNGLVCYPFARSIADATLRMLADPASSRAMGQAGRHDFDHSFTWPGTVATLLALYRDLAGLPSRRSETIHGD